MESNIKDKYKKFVAERVDYTTSWQYYKQGYITGVEENINIIEKIKQVASSAIPSDRKDGYIQAVTDILIQLNNEKQH